MVDFGSPLRAGLRNDAATRALIADEVQNALVVFIETLDIDMEVDVDFSEDGALKINATWRGLQWVFERNTDLLDVLERPIRRGGAPLQ